MKISVLAFDLSDNATGRAELLARLLAPRYDVAVVGPQFRDTLWEPVASSPIRYAAVRAGRHPRFAASVPTLLRRIDGDLLYVSKPRPTSYGLGLLARARRRRPLVLDIDDWELGFFYRSTGWSRVGQVLNVGNPNGFSWTWLCEQLTGRADAITVASRFLEARFGGVLIPHARDTDAWDPDRFDPGAVRSTLGIGERPLVMFLGTPRGYKGVDDLVEAVGRLPGQPLLALVGPRPDSDAARRWAARPWVRLAGPVAFDDVPRYLVAADVVAVPQRATSDTLGQVPAKLVDAMALARPIVTTAVSMIPEVIDGCGLVIPPGDVAALASALGRLLADRPAAVALGQRARQRCIAQYSFAAVRAKLYPLIDDLLAGRSR